MGKITEERRKVTLVLNKFHLFELKRVLWNNGILPPEFFSYLVKLLITGDSRIHALLDEVKVARAKQEVLDIVHTDDESIYNLIEQALSNRKER